MERHGYRMSEKKEINEFQNGFIIEQIKERPVNKGRLAKRTLFTAVMAVVFGLIACFTFLLLEPIISNWMYPEEPPRLVTFPEDDEEMSPEEMLTDTMQNLQNQQEQQGQNQQEASQAPEVTEPLDVILTDEQVEEILAQVVLDMENYQEVYEVLSDKVQELRKSMVTIMGITSNVDWLNSVMESSSNASGVIIADNGKELLILTEYEYIEDAQELLVEYHNGAQTSATIKAYEKRTDLAVLAVEREGLPEEFLQSITIARLGSTNILRIAGTPVIAMGRPMGTNGSIGYGMIAGETTQSFADAKYRLLQTNIYGSKKASGMLFDMRGHLIGVITNDRNRIDMSNLIEAYGISDIRKLIENLSNDTSIPYMGIFGENVTNKISEEQNIPQGVYVRKVEMNSPAMLAGIQVGDILIGIDDFTTRYFRDYMSTLAGMSAGRQVTVELMRQSQEGYKEMKINITLGELGK